MKRALQILLILLTVVLALSGCSVGAQSSVLKICGSYAVPGMFYSDLKGVESSVEVLDEDSEGRILFEYTTKSVITEKEETVLVICQKYDSEYVYFYEDICYLLSDYEDADIAGLKEKNDWDEPLDDSKMSRRRNKATSDLVIVIDSQLEYKEIRSATCKEVDINKSQINELCFVDCDYNGKEMYFLSAQDNDIMNKYLLIVDTSYNAATLEIKDNTLMASEVSAFKQENGWCYGISTE